MSLSYVTVILTAKSQRCVSVMEISSTLKGKRNFENFLTLTNIEGGHHGPVDKRL